MFRLEETIVLLLAKDTAGLRCAGSVTVLGQRQRPRSCLPALDVPGERCLRSLRAGLTSRQHPGYGAVGGKERTLATGKEGDRPLCPPR